MYRLDRRVFIFPRFSFCKVTRLPSRTDRSLVFLYRFSRLRSRTGLCAWAKALLFFTSILNLYHYIIPMPWMRKQWYDKSLQLFQWSQRNMPNSSLKSLLLPKPSPPCRSSRLSHPHPLHPLLLQPPSFTSPVYFYQMWWPRTAYPYLFPHPHYLFQPCHDRSMPQDPHTLWYLFRHCHLWHLALLHQMKRQIWIIGNRSRIWIKIWKRRMMPTWVIR